MFRRIRSELQCSEALGQNFNVWIDKVRILMFGRGQEGGRGGGGEEWQNFNVWNNIALIPMFLRIRSELIKPEFQYLKG